MVEKDLQKASQKLPASITQNKMQQKPVKTVRKNKRFLIYSS